MKKDQLINIFLDITKDFFWIIDLNFQLIYANKAYLKLIKEVTGVEMKLSESVLVEGFGEGYIEKWKAYYKRALEGENFEIEGHFYNPQSNQIQYSQVTFEPLMGNNCKVYAIVCQSKDITHLATQRSVASQMMDASLDVFCTVNEQGNFMYVSAAAKNHWGYSPEELIGKPFKDLILVEDLPKTNKTIDAIKSGQEIKSFVNRYRKKNGGIAYNLWAARWDASSKLRYAVARDFTEKIRQEEELLQNEKRFRALVQEGSDLIAILDLEGNYKYVSPTSTTILGIDPEELIGRNAFEYIHPDDVERTLACLEEITIEKRVIIPPFRFKNHKMEWRWIETVLTNMLDNSAIMGIVANSRDITDKIEEERKLKLLKSVITNTNDAVLITEVEPLDDPGPRIIFVNKAFTKMTGYKEEEVIGKTPRILQGPKSDKIELKRLGESLRNHRPHEVTTINYRKNGEEFWINFTVTPVANEMGRYTHFIAIERDVTEQKNKELENELVARISKNFSIEHDYISSVDELCKSIGKFGNFDWVELWTTNLEESKMQLFSHYLAEPDDERFYDYSLEVKTYRISEGLAGKVWAERVQVIWNDDDISNDFARADAAKKIGLKSVLGIPLIFNDEFLGVLKIGTKHNANYFKNYTRIFNRLEGFIGSELNRKKLENNLGHFFNAIPDIICLLDFQGKFLKMNKAGYDLLGYSEENILYHTLDEFVHSEENGVFVHELKRLDREETKFKFESRVITPRGEFVWLSWYCNLSRKEDLIYASAKNITEEKKLRELNLQANRLARIGSWEVNVLDQSIFWSKEVHQLHDTDPSTFVPNFVNSINLYRKDFKKSVQSNFEKCISIGEPFDFEAVLVTAKKKELWVRVIGNAEIVDGKVNRIYGSFQDINDRKEAEIRLQSLANNLPGVVFQYLVYPNGTDVLKYVTKGSKKVWGFTAEEVLENSQLVWDRIMAGGEIEAVQKSISNSIASKTNWTAKWKYVMPSGEIKTLIGYGSPYFLADRTVRFNSIVLDITQEAKNEELLARYTLELERSNEELEQFAFVASHDLQEPLRMVSSFMDQLSRKYGDQLDEKAHQYIHFATDGAKRMKQIILDLLEYSRATRPTEGKEEVDLNQVFSEFKSLRRKLIIEKSAEFNSTNLPTLTTYKAAITQIFHCLLDNALKYSHEVTPPKVEIKAVENEKEWKFSIKDNGIGIDPQFFDKIFVIFQRLHNKDQYAGTGIGLSIAKRHVEFLGGRIWLDSVPGVGTVFYFTIPKIKPYG